MEGFWVLTTIVSFVLWMSQLGKIRTLRDALAQAEGKRASEKENCDVQITRAKADCAESIAKTKADCETQIAKVKADCADSVSRTKVDCADSIAKIKADCEKQIALEKERSQNEAYDIIGTIADGKKELASLLQTILVESINLASYEEFSSEEIKNKAQMIELQASEMIKNDKAVSGAGLAGDTNRQANNRKRQILRCFSAEFDLIA
ncbi:MAG: hypothetical protein LBR85_07285, partial [Oscillospiraceae bacterium]|nr:hypothetical protein [Oscillospiraceae bacterium]